MNAKERERTIAAMRKNGYSERMINKYLRSKPQTGAFAKPGQRVKAKSTSWLTDVATLNMNDEHDRKVYAGILRSRLYSARKSGNPITEIERELERIRSME